MFAAHIMIKTILINNELNGLKINLNCGSTYLAPLRKAILENEADMGFSFDGDADRVIAVDENGSIVRSDILMAVFIKDIMNSNDSIIYDVKC